MKEVAVLLLLALLLNGCGSGATAVQGAAGGGWEANLSGGEGKASGFSFVTQFSVNGGGALSVSNFQFLTQITGGCFPVSGEDPTGTLNVSYNADGVVSGTFSFLIVSNGNTLTLTSNEVTGSFNTTGNILTGATIMGMWALTGGTGCNDVSGTFTMTQSNSTTT